MNSNQSSKSLEITSLRKASIIAGIGLLVMAILAPIANFSALQNLIVQGDPTATSTNIIGSIGLFRIGICFFLIVAILDIVVAWALYLLFIPVNRSLSLLSAWFRIVYATIFAVAVNHLFQVYTLLNGVDFLKIIETKLLHVQVMLQLNAFQSEWNLGMVIFGLHLLILGCLVFKSGYFPKFLGILILVSGLGYISDSLGKLIFPDIKISIAMYTFIGEVLLIFWLFWRGIKGFGNESNLSEKKIEKTKRENAIAQ